MTKREDIQYIHALLYRISQRTGQTYSLHNQGKTYGVEVLNTPGTFFTRFMLLGDLIPYLEGWIEGHSAGKGGGK